MNRKRLYYIGVGVGISVYLILLGISIIYIPMHLFLRMLPPIVVVGFLLCETPGWVKCVVAVLLFIAGVYALYFNDIIGPLNFAIHDRPFDIPAQFNNSWRYFWIMAYLNQLSWTWGIPSVFFLICYKARHIFRSDI